MLWQPFSQNTTEVHKFYCMCAMDTMYIPYFVSSLHPHPLRYWSVLLLFPTKLAFNDKRLVSSLQHTTQCWRQQNIKIHCAPEKLHTVLMIHDDFYATPDKGTKYSADCVCLSACLSVLDHIFTIAHPIFTNFCALYLWQQLGPSLASKWYDTYFWFMNDATYAHKRRLLDTATQLRRTSHTQLLAWLLTARRNTRCRQRMHGTPCSHSLQGHSGHVEYSSHHVWI